MPSVVPLSLLLILLWVLLAAALTFWQLGRVRPLLPGIALVLAAALVVRLVPALVWPGGARYEQEAFRLGGIALLQGQNVYVMPVAHPYMPLIIYWYAAAAWLAGHGVAGFSLWAKLPGILADVALAGLVFLAVRRERGAEAARRAACIYAFNPVTTMVVAYQGQFDSIPLLLLMASIYSLEARRAGRAALHLGLGILSKTWPAMLVPLVWLRQTTWRERIVWALGAGIVPLAGLLAWELRFPGSWSIVIRRGLGAGATPGWWGYAALFNVFQEVTGQGTQLYLAIVAAGKVLAVVAAALMMWHGRRQPLGRAVLWLVLALFACVPNLGLQGLSWPIGLALLAGEEAWLGRYVGAALIEMVISYWGIHLADGLAWLMPAATGNLIVQLSSVPVWGVIVWWLATGLRQECPLDSEPGRRVLPDPLPRP